MPSGRRASTARKPEDLAILIYTSGTTGKPKGAMLSHRNLLSAVRGFNTLIAQDEDDERMCFLPLCHVAERMGGAYFSLYTGAKLNFVENPETIPENVREIAPTVFVAVPRIWEKFYSGVMIALKESNAFEQLGLQAGHRHRPGEGAPLRGRPADRRRPEGAVHWLARCWC
jgi:long-chain acyl-CoA synthetase